MAVGCGGDSVNAPGTATLAITTSTSGVEPDPDGYIVQIDAGAEQAIQTAGTLQVPDVATGDHTVLLAGMASNCTVQGDNPRAVSLASGQTASIDFSVTCTATTGGVQVTAATSGPSPDADGYTVTVDGTDRGVLGVSAALSIAGLTPGDHVVGLGGVAGNCQVGGNNPRTISVTAGANLDLPFTVTCSTPAPGSGTLRIQTTTTGPDPDPNGYTFALDGGPTQSIGVSASTSLSNTSAGAHTVELSSLASNCAVQGENPRAVTVQGGTTADVSFAIVCAATTGTIRVSVSTSGAPIDPDGYGVKVDDRSRRTLGTSGATTVAAPAGDHTVELTGVAPNCQVAEGRARPVTVEVGAVRQVSFAVTCTATTGAIQVSVTSSGSSPDLDGYIVDLDDGGARKPIDANGTTTLTGVAAGGHTVTLIAVALNCTVPEGAEQFVTVPAGGTVEARFAVVCSPTGDAWTAVSLPTGFRGSAIYGTSATDIFVSGVYEGSSDGLILHYDGQTWSEQFRTNQVLLGGLWGSAATNVFAAGHPTGGSLSPGLVLRYDGSGWSDMGPQGEFDHFLTVWGTSPSDLFVGGWFDAIPSTGLIRHYDGTAWSPLTGHPFGANGEITDLTGVSPTEVYALGSSADEGASRTYGIARYDGTAWTPSFAAAAQQLNGVWAVGANDAFAVANAGYIFRYDGAAWNPMLSPTGNNLTDVWGNSGTNVYAVGDGGILHYDGSSWSFSSSEPGRRVWGTDSEVFVLTDTAVLRKSGT
ncbi:MAG TPA: hypothetical protein VF252_10930 [Gemmatimonadales bacterium]